MSFQVILIVHVLLALGLIALILMQHGKGADAGAAFGAGASGSVFGARGANSFIYKLTTSVAVGFFLTSLTLAYLATSDASSAPTESQSVMDQVLVDQVPIKLEPSVDVPMVDSKVADKPVIDNPKKGEPAIDSKAGKLLVIGDPKKDELVIDLKVDDISK